MHIPLSGLEKGPRVHHHRASATEYLVNNENFAGEITIQAVVHKEGGLLCINLTADLPGTFICDRCGSIFSRHHHARSDFYFSYGGKSAFRKDPDITEISPGAVELDISQEIRDLVILSLPYQFFCKEDCRGLCAGCGANLNEEECRCENAEMDPRWEVLRRLK